MILQAEVHVYLQSNMITYIVESQDYEFNQLLGDLGGVVGLYVGMTVVTFFELAELFCLLLYIVFRRCTSYVTKREIEEIVSRFPKFPHHFQVTIDKERKRQHQRAMAQHHRYMHLQHQLDALKAHIGRKRGGRRSARGSSRRLLHKDNGSNDALRLSL